MAGRPVGINSAGIGQREWDAPIIFAGRAERLAQRRPARTAAPGADRRGSPGTARRRRHVSQPAFELRALAPADGMRVAGFSATPFRLDSGRLDEGDGKIFDDVVFDYGIGRESATAGCRR